MFVPAGRSETMMVLSLDFAVAGGVREADAPLIAAAPEMYQALLTIAVWPKGEPIERIQGIASAALDKARGE